jgi:hypothetical protein
MPRSHRPIWGRQGHSGLTSGKSRIRAFQSPFVVCRYLPGDVSYWRGWDAGYAVAAGYAGGQGIHGRPARYRKVTEVPVTQGGFS